MRQYRIIQTDTSKRVVKIKVRLVGSKFSGTIYITDIMLQGGTIPTEWNGYPSEIKWVM